jgi:hypothetical protein
MMKSIVVHTLTVAAWVTIHVLVSAIFHRLGEDFEDVKINVLVGMTGAAFAIFIAKELE